MEERATGIILRVRPLTESSLIVHWLTAEHGRIATVAKGARRPKSTFRGKLDLFFHAEFSYGKSQRSELHTLKELQLKESYPALRTNLEYIQQASYAAALIEQVTETETPVPEFYELMSHFLDHLATRPTGPLPVFAFEMKTLIALGQQPEMEATRMQSNSRALLQQLGEAEWANLSSLESARVMEREIQRFLHGFLIFQLGKIPASRGAAIDFAA